VKRKRYKKIKNYSGKNERKRELGSISKEKRKLKPYINKIIKSE